MKDIITKGEWAIKEEGSSNGIVKKEDAIRIVSYERNGFDFSDVCAVWKDVDDDLEVSTQNAKLIALAGNLAQLHSPETWQLKLDAYERMREALESIVRNAETGGNSELLGRIAAEALTNNNNSL